MRRRCLLAHTLAACCLAASLAQAEQFPRWEAGAGLAAISFPDYRGSDERQAYLLPVPYFVYRGDVVKVDRQAVRGLFFRSDRVELDFSVNGSVPVDSEDNRARQGMPDLDPTLELGPSIKFTLARSQDKDSELQLRLPLRAVVATDFSRVYGAGLVFQPHLNLDLFNLAGSGWNLGLLGGVIFANRKHHQYFYGVADQFATADRPAYSADGGFGGTQFIASLSRRFPNYWLGGFVKFDSLRGATFEDSPLIKNKNYFTAGVAITWIFARAKEMVESRD